MSTDFVQRQFYLQTYFQGISGPCLLERDHVVLKC